MCGILAVANLDGKRLDSGLVERMRDAMYHRGPDGAGLLIDGQIGLAHRRLAIIDLTENGRQPMSNEDGSVSLVCNGEIYNFVELREELKKKGHRFSSSSDSEIILHQYEEDGVECLEKFNGMFSFVLWDRRKNIFFMARDRFGIKPLYYYLDGAKAVFASEIKAILEDPEVSREPDLNAVADYFFAGKALGGKTMFRGIRELAPGHRAVLDIRSGKLVTEKYWDLRYDYNYSRGLADVTEELYELLDDAVMIHCRSDAPLGCHLSGGLDTSTVTALAARHRKSLKAFSIKFSDDPVIDETSYARAVAGHTGAEYVEGTPSAVDMATLLPFHIWNMETPLITEGGFSYYTVSKLASRHVKVSLTGHGGDEIFAGYPAQFLASYGSTSMFDFRVDNEKLMKDTQGASVIKRLLSGGLQGIYGKIERNILKKEKTLEDVWVQTHCGFAAKDNPFLQKGFVDSSKGYSPLEEFLRPLREAKTDKPLDRCLYHDLMSYLPGLLQLEDRASMSVSIESRVPLLDYRLVEFLATVPPEQKVEGLQPKFLLRKVASRLLPEKVWKRRDKRNFPIPGKFWLSKEMKDLTREALTSPECLERGIFVPKKLNDAIDTPDTSTLTMLNLEMWFKLFIDRDPRWIARAASVAA